MGNRRTRQIVRYLLDRGPMQVELGSLVDTLAREDAPVEEDGREEIAVDLHHCVLPQLSAARFIDYDARSNTLDYRPTPRETRVLRALVTTTRWSENAVC